MTLTQIYRQLIETYRASRKHGLDGEFFLYRLYRPISFPLSTLLIRLGFTANQVTSLSLMTLVLAAGLFLMGEREYLIWGAFSYALAFILDFADGNIARFHNCPNYFGKLIDGFVDTLSCILFIAVAYGNTLAGLNLIPDVIEMAIGITTTFAVLVTHYFRMRVAYFLKESGVTEREMESPTGVRAQTGDRLVRFANKLYKNLATSTPIALLILTPLDLLTPFILFFFAIHVVMGLSEIFLSLFRLRRRLDVYRAY